MSTIFFIFGRTTLFHGLYLLCHALLSFHHVSVKLVHVLINIYIAWFATFPLLCELIIMIVLTTLIGSMGVVITLIFVTGFTVIPQ